MNKVLHAPPAEASIMGKIRRKLPANHYKLLTAQKGFSPLLILLPIALVIVVGVFVLQSRLGQQFQKLPSPTPQASSQDAQLDSEACNDQYNADCIVADDEGDDVRPEDLLGPD